ncbi:calcium-binding protein [Acuticoccus kalidii]|uniref:calcium-binding protein n=1 Tax=Acuticoccus kalidii TaxID=2910977 RepID=UPI002106D625|nr:calcium-binding protein [Acuticoccus kalidii]
MLELGDLGTQVYLYVPGTGEFVELTDEAGFGDAKNKYTWSATLFDKDGPDQPGLPELYVGTLNSQLGYVGGIGASVTLNAAAQTGGQTLFDLIRNTSEVSPDLREFLGSDFPNVLQSDGPEIWKYNFESETWTRSYDVTPDSLVNDEDLGFRDAVSYDGAVYFSSSTSLIFSLLEAGNNPAKIVYSRDGEDWQAVSGGPLDVDGTASIRALTVVDAPDGAPKETALLVGTENVTEGAQLWLYYGDDVWSPAPIAEFDGEDGRPYAAAVAETLETENGDIYIGTWYPYGLFKLTDAGVEDVTPDFESLGDGVMQMIEYDGYFYIGSVNYFNGGATLLRTTTPEDPESWMPITLDGFQTELPEDYDGRGVSDATYIWQTAIIEEDGQEVLYIGDFSGPGKLLRLAHDQSDTDLSDGKAYSLEVVTDALGDNLSFGEDAYGIRKLVPVHVENVDGKWIPTNDQSLPANAMIIGSADPFNTETEDFLSRIIDRDGDTVFGGAFAPDTIEGGSLEDLLLGGMAGDLISGHDEDDFIVGDFWGLGVLGGNDTIDGGDGADIIFGNSGNDLIDGGEGEDFLIGGAGRDVMFGGDGIDIMLGDFVTDGEVGKLIAPLLENLVGGLLEGQEPGTGPSLDDMIAEISGTVTGVLDFFGQLNDTMFGQDGNDIMIGGLGRDRMFGGAGDDIIYGSEGGDRLFGNAGNDLLFGEDGDDFMSGGLGNDVFVSGVGNDTMVGGLGADRYLIKGGESDDLIESGDDIIVGFQKGQDVIDLSLFFDTEETGELAFDYASHLASAFGSTDEGWLIIDLAELNGNADGDLGDTDGSGTLVVIGLRAEDVTIDDFVFDSSISDQGGGFFG